MYSYAFYATAPRHDDPNKAGQSTDPEPEQDYFGSLHTPLSTDPNEKPPSTPRVLHEYESMVFWALLPERQGAANDHCYNSHIDLAIVSGRHENYRRMQSLYSRTDIARNRYVDAFYQASDRDNDLLVMLDADHKYPPDVLERFEAHDPSFGVVGALAFRRGDDNAPHDPLYFLGDDDGRIGGPKKIKLGQIEECMIVSTSAIGIRRWVIIELLRKGYLPPFFRYEYPVGNHNPTEDIYFGNLCNRAGIPHYVDTGLIIPHSAVTFIDEKSWKEGEIIRP